ncbi:MAG: hypothetical protein ACOC1F_13285 [Myxococcota bacterium]
MVRPPEHSVPPSQPAPLRHLGTGNAGGDGDRPIRVQIIVALVVGLVLAVPLYLWRRPKITGADAASSTDPSAIVSASRPPPDPSKLILAAALDGGVETDDVKLGRVWTDSCHRSGIGKTPPEQCDRQPFFEEALVKAVLDNTACAPKLSKGGSISYAMKIDHRRKSVSLFAGKSGTVRRRTARESIECVERAIPKPRWESLPHQHTRYIIAVLATYPPADATKR